MGLFDLFRRPPPVDDLASAIEFLDSHTAFAVQKCTYEYARARSGTNWQKLFNEAAFKQAVEASCWLNFPIALADLAEMMLSVLRAPHGPADPDLVAGIAAAAAAVARRHPVPDGFTPTYWSDAVASVAARLAKTGYVPARAVKDMPKDTAQAFFDHLPFHPEVRANDFLLIRNTRAVNLCRACETLERRGNLPALRAVLAAEGARAAAGSGG